MVCPGTDVGKNAKSGGRLMAEGPDKDPVRMAYYTTRTTQRGLRGIPWRVRTPYMDWAVCSSPGMGMDTTKSTQTEQINGSGIKR